MLKGNWHSRLLSDLAASSRLQTARWLWCGSCSNAAQNAVLSAVCGPRLQHVAASAAASL